MPLREAAREARPGSAGAVAHPSVRPGLPPPFDTRPPAVTLRGVARLTLKSGGISLPPLDLDGLLAVDEGPMRGDLRRQIGYLERQLSRINAIVAPWELRRASPCRGPAVLSAASLEQIRDELLDAVRAVRDRLARDGE